MWDAPDGRRLGALAGGISGKEGGSSPLHSGAVTMEGVLGPRWLRHVEGRWVYMDEKRLMLRGPQGFF